MENCKCNHCGAPPEINIPELLPDLDAPGSQGSWRQLFSVNIGRMVKIEVGLIDGTVRSVMGEIYAVGNAWVALSCGDKIVLTDIFAVKFATFC